MMQPGRQMEITLFVTNSYVTAYQAAQGSLRLMGRWSVEIEGLLPEDFTAFLEQQKEAIFSLVADIAEEEFAIEDIPRLRMRDAKAMVARKLAQRFRLADYRHAYRIDKSDWRDWNKNIPQTYVFTALTQITPIEVLVDHLQLLQTRVKGVYTTPMLAAAAIPGLLKTGAGLLLVEHMGGLRQVLVVDGYVRFARLAPIANAADAEFLEQELNRMIQYLQIGRLVSNDVLSSGALEVHIFSRRPAVKMATPVLAGLALTPVWHGLESVVGSLAGLDDSTNPYGMEPMYAVPPVRAHCGFFYRPPTLIRHWQTYQSRQFLKLLSSGLTIAALLAVVVLQWHINAEYDRDQYLQWQTQKMEQEYARVRASFPSLPEPAAILKNKVDLLQKMASRSSSAPDLMNLLGQHFAAFPDLRLSSVSWLLVEGGGNNEPGTLPASNLAPAQPPSTPPSVSTELKPRLFLIEGLLVPTRPLTKHESNQLVRDLQDRLSKTCSCEIETKLPFDVSQQGVIVDQVGDFIQKIEPAKFSLTLKFQRKAHEIRQP